MTKKSNDMMIGSIKLVNGGFKGLEIKYLETNVKNGNTFIDEVSRKRKLPIPGEMINLFEDLGNYLLDICGYTTAEVERKILLNNLEITGVDAGSESFLINGKLKVLTGTKTIPLNTPLIKESDEFDGFDAVMELVTSIYKEAKEYVGGKMMNQEQLVMTFYKDKDGFDPKEFAKLPDAEKKRIATSALEEMGVIVIDQSEVDEVIDGNVNLGQPQLGAGEQELVIEEIANASEDDDLQFELGE